VLQPPNATSRGEAYPSQSRAMTSVDENREHTLVEEPFQQRFDEKSHIRTQNKSMPFSPLMIGLSVQNQSVLKTSLGWVAPIAADRCVFEFTSWAFIGFLCPTNNAGIRSAIVGSLLVTLPFALGPASSLFASTCP